ncbi:hypothetical protein CYMTET_5284 [Cymbomonas tetramitiformis]|uniref:Uncharacterized protein n=1 Tax=Cymbomonas tetramitiformis TaxID=36881 RepID=A0AAE0LJ84_9CHLO|nr:hypothetical protein CYMTET_5284 [Cymbomonas tetramitiformis]
MAAKEPHYMQPTKTSQMHELAAKKHMADVEQRKEEGRAGFLHDKEGEGSDVLYKPRGISVVGDHTLVKMDKGADRGLMKKYDNEAPKTRLDTASEVEEETTDSQKEESLPPAGSATPEPEGKLKSRGAFHKFKKMIGSKKAIAKTGLPSGIHAGRATDAEKA